MSFSSSGSLPVGPGDAGVSSAEDLWDFQQMIPDTSPRSQPTAPTPVKPLTSEDSERVNVVIVTVLTLACTALALFDLFLLALGS